MNQTGPVDYHGCSVDTSDGAMDVSTGVFKVKVPGTYQLSFTGFFSTQSKDTEAFIEVNGENLAQTNMFHSKGGLTLSTHAMMIMHPLHQDDNVQVTFMRGDDKSELFADSDREIHFTALLVDREITLL